MQFGYFGANPAHHLLREQDTTLDVMKGYNGTIFAYGQTGSGKTHTMMGPDINDQAGKGVIPNAIDHIFECIAADTSGAEIQLGVSYMEVYREVIRDLLDPSKVNLQVRDSPLKGIYVEDLTYEFVTCKEDIVELLEMGQKARKYPPPAAIPMRHGFAGTRLRFQK